MDNREVELNGKAYVLGKKYRDAKLGNVGLATAGINYLTGCDMLSLAWNDSTGRPVEQWVHVTDIEEVETATQGNATRNPGGPPPSFAGAGK